MQSFKPQVQTDNSGRWYDNALRFETEAEAFESAESLAQRWFSVIAYRAAPCDEPPKHKLVDGKLVFLS